MNIAQQIVAEVGSTTEWNDYDAMVAQLRSWVDARGISSALLDELSGLSKGHSGKLLGDAQVKQFGLFSLFAIMATLGIRCRFEEDPAMAEQMRPHWEHCNVKQRRIGNVARPVGKTTLNRMTPIVAREMGRKGGKACSGSARRAAAIKGGKASKRGLTKRQRADIARKAAVARWAKRNAHRDILVVTGEMRP